MSNTRNENSIGKKILSACAAGTGVMLIQAPFVNALNSWSVAECRMGVSGFQVVKAIYQGKVNGKMRPSASNFLTGIMPHFFKEVPRIGFKSTGLFLLKPRLDQQFAPRIADVAFAGSLALAELSVNPLDVARVRNQAGVRYTYTMQAMFAGSAANVARQFLTWWGFSYSSRITNKLINEHTNMDSRSLSAQFAKALPQSLFFTTMVYPFIERGKNAIQFGGHAIDTKKSVYAQVNSSIYRTYGLKGFAHGFFPKVLSNALLAAGSNVLVMYGERSLSSPDERSSLIRG